ncbi:MAG: sigma-54-dependent transcriptional regulator [Thermodesulfobacteriota bacterium]
MATVLIVDDDASLRVVLEIALERRGHSPLIAEDTAQARLALEQQEVDLILLDVRLGRENGVDLLREVRQSWPELPVIMITAYADSHNAVEAMKLGASDYIHKPFDVQELLLIVERSLQNFRLQEENQWLKKAIQEQYGEIIGESQCMREMLHLAERVAPTLINILVTGESGTGKELVARAIHEFSPRRDNPLMVINCGGLPENLVESELFGYRRGAFTGADKPKKGLLELADSGTAFLDEVAELSPSTQVKLLRCVQEKSFIPLGGTSEVKTDVRIIAATNRNVDHEVSQGTFREDLYYRLSGMIIHLPPLRERGQDIVLLAEHFLHRACREQKRPLLHLSQQAKEKLLRYNFPGNVRELENIIERAVALEQGNTVTPSSLLIYEPGGTTETSAVDLVLHGERTLEEHLQNEEHKILKAALESTGGRKSQAAQLVGLNFRQFRYRWGKYAPDETDPQNIEP